MKQTFTNGAILLIGQVLWGGNGYEGITKKNLKTKISIRQVLKFNYAKISEAYKTVNELADEVMIEIMEGFVAEEKAEKVDEGYKIGSDYMDECNKIINEKMVELEAQTVELEINKIQEKDYLDYLTMNDGLLTDKEMDTLEIFVAFEDSEEE